MALVDPKAEAERGLAELESLRADSERRLARVAEEARRQVLQAARAAAELPRDAASILERAAVVLTEDVEFELNKDRGFYHDGDERPSVSSVFVRMGRGVARVRGADYPSEGFGLVSEGARLPLPAGSYRALFALIPLPEAEGERGR